MEIPDEVRRELEIEAPLERVWASAHGGGPTRSVVPRQARRDRSAAGRRRRARVGRGQSAKRHGRRRWSRPAASCSGGGPRVRRPFTTVSFTLEEVVSGHRRVVGSSSAGSRRSPMRSRPSRRRATTKAGRTSSASSRSTWRPRDRGSPRARSSRHSPTRLGDASCTSCRRTARSPRRSSRGGSRSRARRSRSTSSRWRKRGSRPATRVRPRDPLRAAHPGLRRGRGLDARDRRDVGPAPRRVQGVRGVGALGLDRKEEAMIGSVHPEVSRELQRARRDEIVRALQGMPPRIRSAPKGAAMTTEESDVRTGPQERPCRPIGRGGVPTLHGAHRPMVAGGGPLTGCRRAVRRRRQGGAGRLRASCRWPPLRGHVRGCRGRLG